MRKPSMFWKSLVLRVTSIKSCANAVAAISESNDGLGLGMCNAAQRKATFLFTGKVLLVKLKRTTSSQDCKASAFTKSLLCAANNTPFCNSKA